MLELTKEGVPGRQPDRTKRFLKCISGWLTEENCHLRVSAFRSRLLAMAFLRWNR